MAVHKEYLCEGSVLTTNLVNKILEEKVLPFVVYLDIIVNKVL